MDNNQESTLYKPEAEHLLPELLTFLKTHKIGK